jgi:DNA mismatch repair protein MSH6
MAQLGMFVPASKARQVSCSNIEVTLNEYYVRLSPVDSIITRMGAYDNMFAHASTFKVELDEWYVGLRSVSHIGETNVLFKF